jgi:hypothetical protein
MFGSTPNQNNHITVWKSFVNKFENKLCQKYFFLFVVFEKFMDFRIRCFFFAAFQSFQEKRMKNVWKTYLRWNYFSLSKLFENFLFAFKIISSTINDYYATIHSIIWFHYQFTNRIVHSLYSKKKKFDRIIYNFLFEVI